MGSLYRSQEMILCQMYLQSDTAYAVIAQLGELGIVQFRDMNANVNTFQRNFVNEVRRCEEMERQLRFFERELTSADVKPVELRDVPEAPAPKHMIDLEAVFENSETELREINGNLENLERAFNELSELRFVLQQTDTFFKQADSHEFDVGSMSDGSHEVEEVRTSTADPNLRYTTGVIPATKIFGFNRLLWLVSRGTIFMRYVEIPTPMKDPVTGDEIMKCVFVAMCHGERLNSKLRKIAEGYHATIYPCPPTTEERQRLSIEVEVRLQDLVTVLEKSKEQRSRTLHNIALHIASWNIKVLKLKACHHMLNMLHNEGQNYVAECWLPFSELGTVQALLDRTTELAGSQVPSILHPVQADFLPTYHKVNKFTRAFQVIIDAYGIASYREVNPAVFSIITFPFLFSVMFGDAGHGLLMLFFALFLVLFEFRLKPHAEKSEIFSIIFGGRYMILLMSIFSIYSGLMYNDCFSKAFNIFGNTWHVIYDEATLRREKEYTLDSNDSRVYNGDPYRFGVDPVWSMSENKITFTNSFKKKISVIFGVCQMLLGVMLGLCNHIYFRNILNIFAEFLPMLLFLLSIFGYLVGLIFAKWIVFSTADSNCAPNILIGFINMFMMKYDDSDNNECANRTWYPGQKSIQTFLVVLAVICAIWLLTAKPLALYFRHRGRHGQQRLIETNDGAISTSDRQPLYDGEGDGMSRDTIISLSSSPSTATTYHSLTKPTEHEEPFDFGDAFIHQAIHMIEFCLGCISHTASYLRLWALSLAHSELSEVLWTMVMNPAFNLKFPLGVPALAIFVLFAPFAVLTVVILLLMEGLSAFLHTLRLHWVEFNSKFYKGEGRAFEPFSFSELMTKQEY